MLAGGDQIIPKRVSVIVPTYNRSDCLVRALASIRAVEGPDLRFEIIVGDNGDCPRAAEVAAQFGARYVKAERPGASKARNAALALATGDYIAFLDDDDAWLPTHVRPHLKMLDQRPDLDGVIAQVRHADEQLRPYDTPAWPVTHPGEGDELVRRMLSGYFPQIGTVVVRASVRKKSGGFDAQLIGGEDLDWLMRLSGRHALGYVEVPCILFSQRQIGEYDALQKLRVGFDRKVFRRHALKQWRVWRSPREYMRAYSGSLMHFYRYFVDAGLMRAARGERTKALAAIWTAFGIFPFRAMKHMVTNSPMRQALVLALFVWPAAHRAHLPVWLAILHI
jgi:glycosyltransferase involved in cell wall biosynthesis